MPPLFGMNNLSNPYAARLNTQVPSFGADVPDKMKVGEQPKRPAGAKQGGAQQGASTRGQVPATVGGPKDKHDRLDLTKGRGGKTSKP